MKNLTRSACRSVLFCGLFLGGASACGSSESGLSSGSSAGSAGASGSAQAGSNSLGGQSQSNSGGSANGGAAPTTGGSSAGGSAGASGSSSGGSAAQAGSAGQAGSAAQAGSGASAGAAGGGATTAHFSFFVTSLEAIRRESKNQNGYGGNLGGLAGADAICTRIAEAALPGSGAKGWKAFLSTSTENAIDRIGKGPWYDRNDKLVASDTAGLLQERPNGMTTVNDLPNELGVPNRAGTGTGSDDNHDTITASNTQGKWDGGATCSDWTSATGSDGPRVGHSWPANSGKNWIQAHTAPGCEPSVALVQMGGGTGNGIGNGGGYGGFYCFALKP